MLDSCSSCEIRWLNKYLPLAELLHLKLQIEYKATEPGFSKPFTGNRSELGVDDFRCTNSGTFLLYPHGGLGSQSGISYLIKSKDQYKLTEKLLFACLIESLLVL